MLMDSATATKPTTPDAEEKDAVSQRTIVPQPSDKTPQEFYAEITQRPEIRTILAALAKQ
jgi:hypothetical protein